MWTQVTSTPTVGTTGNQLLLHHGERSAFLQHGVVGGSKELHKAGDYSGLYDLIDGRIGLAGQQLPKNSRQQTISFKKSRLESETMSASFKDTPKSNSKAASGSESWKPTDVNKIYNCS